MGTVLRNVLRYNRTCSPDKDIAVCADAFEFETHAEYQPDSSPPGMTAAISQGSKLRSAMRSAIDASGSGDLSRVKAEDSSLQSSQIWFDATEERNEVTY